MFQPADQFRHTYFFSFRKAVPGLLSLRFHNYRKYIGKQIRQQRLKYPGFLLQLLCQRVNRICPAFFSGNFYLMSLISEFMRRNIGTHSLDRMGMQPDRVGIFSLRSCFQLFNLSGYMSGNVFYNAFQDFFISVQTVRKCLRVKNILCQRAVVARRLLILCRYLPDICRYISDKHCQQFIRADRL